MPNTFCHVCRTERPIGAHCKHCGEPPRRAEHEITETDRERYYSERPDEGMLRNAIEKALPELKAKWQQQLRDLFNRHGPDAF